MACRSLKYKHPVVKPEWSEFSGVIQCGRCGAHFRRKINACGTKYAKPTWTCMTYSYRGKEHCPAKRIPEDILKQKCAEAMGLPAYDADCFRDRVSSITVPDDGILLFTFRDGTERTVSWKNRSRRESWTYEMKAAARVTTERRHKNG
jgi:site-specific DNA recombinase